jgi:transcriptional regulator with XRE-family HTH domain
MAKRFRDALLERVAPAGPLTLQEVARRAGVSYEQLKKVGQRENASTNVDDARKVANVFGLTLDEFLDDRTIEARIQVVELYSRLSPQERRLLQAASSGLGDQGADQE